MANCKGGCLGAKELWDLFEKQYAAVEAELTEIPLSITADNDTSIEWSFRRIKELLDYNTRAGKRMRGLAVVSTFFHIVGKDNAREEDLRIALTLGWAIEIMQASFLVADDIMDQSTTRRGKLCWYKNKEIGLQAVNDSMLLESCVFNLLRKHCRNKPYYADLVDLFREVIMLTELGQSLDMETSEKPEVDFTCFSDERYMSIVKYKTSFYSFYLPIAIALYITGNADDDTLNKARAILTEMGCYFQVQDDYLDCYGDPAITGKIGTDIESNKCSWLIIKALEHCTDQQREILQNNYGKRDPEKKKAVESVFKEINVEQIYHTYEEETYAKLKKLSEDFQHTKVPPTVFLELLNKIYRRKK